MAIMNAPEFNGWLAGEFELLSDDLTGDPTLIDDLGFDSWSLYVLYCWLLEFTGLDDIALPDDLDFSTLRVSDVFFLYTSASGDSAQ